MSVPTNFTATAQTSLYRLACLNTQRRLACCDLRECKDASFTLVGAILQKHQLLGLALPKMPQNGANPRDCKLVPKELAQQTDLQHLVIAEAHAYPHLREDHLENLHKLKTLEIRHPDTSQLRSTSFLNGMSRLTSLTLANVVFKTCFWDDVATSGARLVHLSLRECVNLPGHSNVFQDWSKLETLVIYACESFDPNDFWAGVALPTLEQLVLTFHSGCKPANSEWVRLLGKSSPRLKLLKCDLTQGGVGANFAPFHHLEELQFSLLPAPLVDPPVPRDFGFLFPLADHLRVLAASFQTAYPQHFVSALAAFTELRSIKCVNRAVWVDLKDLSVWARLPQLETVNVAGCAFSCRALESLSASRTIKNLILGSYPVTVELYSAIRRFADLDRVQIQVSRGPVVPFLRAVTANVKELDIQFSLSQRKLSDGFEKCGPKLQKLILRFSKPMSWNKIASSFHTANFPDGLRAVCLQNVLMDPDTRVQQFLPVGCKVFMA